MTRRNILVVYAAFPYRATLEDSLYAFRRYSNERVYYLNLRFQRAPGYLRRVRFDLIVFHTLFFSARWDATRFSDLTQRARVLRELGAPMIAIPQDEFINSRGVNAFINEFGISHVFSVQPREEWPAIYDTIDRSRVQLHSVLTGYLDTKRLREIDRLAANLPDRTVDICYRAAAVAPPWFGRHGHIKERIAQRTQERAARLGLNVDISTRTQDARNGNSWYEMLLTSKYTIGVEGGTSILDRDGSIRTCSDSYVAAHPTASFEEVEAACFPGLDGTFRGYAISPRHLEACATRTCQILTEGEYSGVLQPHRHYIPLKKDLSNIDQVLQLVRDDRLRGEIVSHAFTDIVESPAYRYEGFVQFVLAQSLGREPRSAGRGTRPLELLVFVWLRLIDVFIRWVTVIRGQQIVARLRMRLFPY